MKLAMPLLLIDFYKATHHDQYPKGMTKLVSYFTPRISRLQSENKLIMFGLQAFIKTYLIEEFQENFFNRQLEDMLNEYSRILDNTLGKNTYNLQKIENLWKLGYLPLEIRAIQEGTRVPMKVPMIEISNTHDDFMWLVNTIESLLSTEMWHVMVSANVGYHYRQIVNKYYELTVNDDIPKSRALGDFSLRGQESLFSAIKSSSAFCLSFLNTATVPAIPFLEKMYNCDCTKEPVAYGAISTEHSVMCSNFSIDGDEITNVRRLLTEIYPNNNFSMVSDSYNYWNMVTNIIPQLKKEIMNHNGTILIRGDSGDPIDIICGIESKEGTYSSPEQKGTVECLWEIFGGNINTKGYKILDSHIKVVYGDSITLERCETIYKRLMNKGFASNNVVLGVGSFSMQCMEENGMLQPFTRDTYGIAVKSTFGETKGKQFTIFKDPKTDTGKFKKSQKGYCFVYEKDDNEITYIDDLYEFHPVIEIGKSIKNNLLQTVFKDGDLIKEYSLKEIRNKLHNNEF